MKQSKSANLSQFTNLYSLQKTLRFELKPVGKTVENIEKKGLLKEDEIRVKDYKVVKKIIDKYHKSFIEEAFELAINQKDKKGFTYQFNKLVEEFSKLYYKLNKEEKDKKELTELAKKMRVMIVGVFKGTYNEITKNKYKNLFGEELIKEEIEKFCENEEEKKQVSNFKRFTTYFKGFHENRKNMYSDEEKSTAISYRVVNDNLTKFLDNLKTINSIQKNKEHKDFQWDRLKKEIKKIDKNISIDDYFSIEGFTLCLNQKGIDSYNLILGGQSLEDGTKIQGLNEFINLYRQQNDLDRKQMPNVKVLFKQILSDREKKSFVPEAFRSDEHLLKTISEYATLNIFQWEEDGKKKNIIKEIQKFLSKINSNQLDKIYLSNDTSLTNISSFLFDDWSYIKRSISHYYEVNVGTGDEKKKKLKKYEDDKEKWLKQKYFSIELIENSLELYRNFIGEKNSQINIESYFSKFISKDENKSEFNLLEKVESSYIELKPILEAEYPKDKNLKSNKDDVEKIKNFLDSIKSIQFFMKPLLPKNIQDEKDNDFYNQLEEYYHEIDGINSIYNKVRNFLTGKVYSEEKFKLNFENSTLLDGWDENKESANLCVMLKDGETYFLGIMDKEHNKILSDIPKPNSKEDFYEKMVYKLLPGPNKMLPKVFFSDSRIDFFKPSKAILKIRESESFKKGDKFNLKDCHTFIDFYKDSIAKHEDWSKFDFQFSKTSSYEDISGFYREVESQGYKLTFNKISKSYIDSLVEEGKLYLFQIYNKDFSKFSKGKPNLHTIYFKSLFDKENLKDVVMKLNGEAEVFYRKSSINYDDKKRKEGHHAKELKGKFNYPILKDKRFSENKFQFHFPITLNFKAKEGFNFNLRVREFLKGNKDINIIGIDRGERHLLYLVMINQEGKILKQVSLNSIQNENKFKGVDYKDLLTKKEEERDKARKSWGTIENIKELKEGYLSQVVHQISKLMVENNAIVVLEDLNIGFKRGRQKVERQVYQKFEKMLIDKLNFLMFKDNKPNEAGGVLNAYQLTDKFESFEKMGKQTGFLFYFPAWNTSKIDPKTGFVNFFHPVYVNLDQAKNLISKIDSIKYNQKKDWFEFKINSKNFFPSDTAPPETVWTICTTHEERYYTSKTVNSSIQYNSIFVTEKLKELFKDFNFQKGEELKDQISKMNDAKFFKDLILYLKVTTSLRQNNGKKGEEEKDFILSPVANSKGEFFNSLNAKPDEPKDADANGAYHIALKGLMNLLSLKDMKDLKKPDWKIKNKDWLEFVWNRNV
ncbi:MAG: type V CRISPR-associated protein Cas12a/Cpf1 [Leptospiraceae bacterium]|nr:type V CRISPR-associated protein Cas12a/Cpf1 [Leptospiraceae bacterium]